MGAEVIFKYFLIACYVILTFALSSIGMGKTKTMKGFAIGNKDMSPYLIGITMAASISSSATFIINPGFVYVDGLSAYLHYGIAAPLGILFAFLILTKGFKKSGGENGALTIPHWIRNKYGSKWLALFFAFINLLSITFIVLIFYASAIVLSSLIGVSYHLSLLLILLFVFSYVLMGGTYAHAYTNAFQGGIMAIIALFIFFYGWTQMQGGFVDNMIAVSPNYASVFNSDSSLYYNFFSVFVGGFFVTAALMFQPHIFTKILYIKSDKDVNKFLVTAIVIGVIFSLMLFIGFYGRFMGIEVKNQSHIVPVYNAAVFSKAVGWGPFVLVVISVALLAAGMSTLDGILVAISAIIVNDIYAPFSKNAPSDRGGLILSRIVLAALGVFVLILCWNPASLGNVGLFAQKGVYGLAAASFAPIIFGVIVKRHIPAWIIAIAAFIGAIGHFILHLGFGMKNPAVSSCWSMFASVAFALIAIKLYKGEVIPVRESTTSN